MFDVGVGMDSALGVFGGAVKGSGARGTIFKW
jgi:hypothetical protein